ncbi:putative uridine nucleosidase 2 [Nymphaea thermarum]|nr:putative uridine nucleosidase 2 [Nymphaea thermarum]
MRGTKLHIANFVHGADGLGNMNFPTPTGKAIEQTAAAFLVSKANLYPGQVTVVALGPLTNIALAMQLDPEFPRKIRQIILLGGAFSVNGNVNPAAEANVCTLSISGHVVFLTLSDLCYSVGTLLPQCAISGPVFTYELQRPVPGINRKQHYATC